jgi:hypothetical protein
MTDHQQMTASSASVCVALPVPVVLTAAEKRKIIHKKYRLQIIQLNLSCTNRLKTLKRTQQKYMYAGREKYMLWQVEDVDTLWK